MGVYEFAIKDFPSRTSKKRLAEIIGTSRKTIQDYHTLAMECCDYYDGDYPSMSLGKSTILLTHASLTPYQCWILWSLWRCVSVEGLPKKALRGSLLNSRELQNKLSRQSFQEYCFSSQVETTTHEEYSNDDTRRLCGIA